MFPLFCPPLRLSWMFFWNQPPPTTLHPPRCAALIPQLLSPLMSAVTACTPSFPAFSPPSCPLARAFGLRRSVCAFWERSSCWRSTSKSSSGRGDVRRGRQQFLLSRGGVISDSAYLWREGDAQHRHHSLSPFKPPPAGADFNNSRWIRSVPHLWLPFSPQRLPLLTAGMWGEVDVSCPAILLNIIYIKKEKHNKNMLNTTFMTVFSV